MPQYVVTAPDGTKYRVTAPAGATQAQVQAQVAQTHAAPAQHSTLGDFMAGALKPLDNLTTAAMHAPVIGPALSGLDWVGQKLGLPSAQQATAGNDQYRKVDTHPVARMFGNIAGTLPTAALPGGALVQGAAAGALLSDAHGMGGIAKDAVIGGVTGKLGQQFGKRIIAPIADRIGSTAPVQAAAKGLSNLIQSTTGRDVSALLQPGMAPVDRAVSKMGVPSTVRTNLVDAQRLGLPYALADADPRLTTLAGSVARNSPDAGALARQTFQPRALGQADRAVAAIDTHLAPVTKIEERAAMLRQNASNAAQPHYDAAYARPAPLDEELNGMLQTPAGSAALKNAASIARNRGMDPAALGFGIDGQGNLMIAKTPTMQTLDLVKQGLDTHLNSSRNPITGKLDLEGDRVAQSVNDLLNRYKIKLDTISPDYAQARATYAQAIQPRNALNLGHEMLPQGNVPMRQFSSALDNATPDTMPELQRGYATAMADQANKMRLSRNPYDAIYGSPDQQAKIGALFPDGAQDFGRAASLERDMGNTALETFGGSQTQPRAMADSSFASDLGGSAMDLAHGIATGGKSTIGKALINAAKTADKGMTESRANQIAPILFDTDTANALRYYDEMARRNAVRGLGSRLLNSAVGAAPVSLEYAYGQ